MRRMSYPIAVPTPASVKTNRPPATPSARPRRPWFNLQALRSAVTPQQTSNEDTKLRKVEESIRVFVRVADPKFRQVVPMRFFNLTLSPAEADACGADYLEEKSPRASVSRVLLRIVAVVARMTTELEELQRAENSPSLWKLHAYSLLALLEAARALSENAARVMAETGEQPAINASLVRLSQRSDLIVSTLAQAGSETLQV